jgi:hypothetical protein
VYDDPDGNGAGTMKWFPPAVTLLFLAPLLGELVSGHQAPLQFLNPILFIALALPYGCGALLCRDFTRRWRTGWLGFLLLSVAYALYEEGIVSRALFDPQWRESGLLAQYDHVAGINWTYGFMLIHFHVAISMLASVMLAELLYPERRHQPWLSNRQAVLCGLVLVLWAPVLALLARADQPLYVPSRLLWALAGATIVALVVAARLIPRRPLPRVAHHAPHPAWFLILGAVNMTAVFGTVFILPEAGVRPPLALSVAFLLALDGATLWLLLSWSGGGFAWDDRHRLALVVGLLAFFLAFGVLSDLEHFEGKSLVSLAAALGLLYVWRRIAGRIGSETSGAAAESTG